MNYQAEFQKLAETIAKEYIKEQGTLDFAKDFEKWLRDEGFEYHQINTIKSLVNILEYKREARRATITLLRPEDKWAVVKGLELLAMQEQYIGLNQTTQPNMSLHSASHLRDLITHLKGEGLTNEKG